MMNLDDMEKIKRSIQELITKFDKIRRSHQKFIPGRTKIQYAGAIYDEKELINMINAIFDGWFSSGKYTLTFERLFAKYLGVTSAIAVNSGSSANLIAISSFFSKRVPENLKLSPGDEIITTALTFPTTVNPIIQNNLVPVFIDVELGTYNPSPEAIEEAISPKTKGIIIMHALGNPNDMNHILDIVDENNLILIEDACDALGSKYDGKFLGTFGHFGTFSFYPAHHITTGEGGMVVTNDSSLGEIARSLRDWGRACVVPVCNPATCGDSMCPRSLKHSSTNIYDLPEDYDKRYTYLEIGYNLKMTEIQAAMGIAQLEKLPRFIELRKRNFKILYEEFTAWEDYFILPKWLPKTDVSWFAFPVTIRPSAPFKRKDIVKYLLKHNIEVKLFFAGNILKHPAYRNIKARIHGSLDNSNLVLRNSFFLGVYPGISEEQIKYVVDVIRKFLAREG